MSEFECEVYHPTAVIEKKTTHTRKQPVANNNRKRKSGSSTNLLEPRLVARLGEYDLTKEVDCMSGVCAPPTVRLDVIDVVVHPDYDGRAHDIAVLKLAADAPYTDFIRPICLPTGKLQPDTTFVASGWGEIPRQGYYSSIKKIVPLPLRGRKACVASYKTFNVPSHVICAGGELGVDTCKGDSGGPLAWVRERIELWGVTSAGNVRCGFKDSPGLYTNVADYLDWILSVVEVMKTAVE